MELLRIQQFGRTYNITIQQLKYYFELIKNGQGFCLGRDEERGKSFASNAPAATQFQGENAYSQKSEVLKYPLFSSHPCLVISSMTVSMLRKRIK